MNQKKTLAIAFFAAVGLTAVHTPDVDAAGARQARTPNRTNQARTARTQTGTRQAAQSTRQSPLKSLNHLNAVKSAVNQWTKNTLEGEPIPGQPGQASYHAAFANVITAEGSATVVRQRSYGSNPQRIKISGAKDGKWRGTLVGTVSVHELGAGTMSYSAWKTKVQGRVSQDRVQISYDHGQGSAKTVLKKGVKSEIVTAVPLEVPLNPTKSGMTRIFYERTNASGRIVGGVGGYADGRTIEIVQQ